MIVDQVLFIVLEGMNEKLVIVLEFTSAAFCQTQTKSEKKKF